MSHRLFCTVELAAEVERAEAELMAACALAARAAEPQAFALPIGTGYATFAGTDSPFTKVAGLGFDGGPTVPELEEVEAAFARVGAAASVELSTLAEHELGTQLVDRGYRLVSFENVLGRWLGANQPRPLPDGVTVEPAQDLEQWFDVVVEGSVHADEQGHSAHEEFPRDAITRAERLLVAAGERPYLGRLHGVPAGGGTWRPAGRIAQIGGAATLPQHRRRGVQSALLDARLHAATTQGLEVAVVTTQPGSKSQQNVQRAGFELLYARAVLVKELRAT